MIKPHRKTRRTPAQRVVSKNYQVSIPKWFFRDQDYQDEHGLIVSGDRLHDNAMMHEMIPIMATPLEMAEWFDKGLTEMGWNDPAQAVEVYEDIKTILENWVNAIPGGVDLPDIDLPLLKLLDRFADLTYKVARRFKTDMPRRLSAADKFRRGGPLGRNQNQATEAQSGDHQNRVKERPKLIDKIEDSLRQRDKNLTRSIRR